jgi:hypothetical protein
MSNKFNFEITVEAHSATGEILAVNFRIRKGKVAKTKEYADGLAFADYDRNGNLLAIELLGPCETKILDKIAGQADAKRFIRTAAPRAMLVGAA